MRTVNTTFIHAGPDLVFRVARDVERWPKLLPHYRWVRIIGDVGNTRVVEMAARQGRIPVKWISTQDASEPDRTITYYHVGGFTIGMWVQWDFQKHEDGTFVTVVHDLNLTLPLVRTRIGKVIVAEYFVKQIADKTLAHIKTFIEEGGDSE